MKSREFLAILNFAMETLPTDKLSNELDHTLKADNIPTDIITNKMSFTTKMKLRFY